MVEELGLGWFAIAECPSRYVGAGNTILLATRALVESVCTTAFLRIAVSRFRVRAGWVQVPIPPSSFSFPHFAIFGNSFYRF